MKENMPLLMLGCIISNASAFLGLHFARAIPVILPYPFIGFGAFVAPTILFMFFNLIILGRKSSTVSIPALVATGLVILTLTLLSGYFQIASSNAASIYVPSATATTWLVMTSLFAAGTVSMFIIAAKSRNIEQLIWTHIILFSWFYTFAFPWLGESL